MANETSLIGLDELLGKLESVTSDVKLKGGRFALRKAANLIAIKAKENARRLDDPTSSEEIAENIAVRWSGKRFKTTGDLAFRVGVMGGARQYANTKHNVRKRRVGKDYHTPGDSGNPGGDTFHWRFLEFGTKRTRATPFMRPALEKNINPAINEFITQYEKAIDRALKRAAKKAKA